MSKNLEKKSRKTNDKKIEKPMPGRSTAGKCRRRKNRSFRKMILFVSCIIAFTLMFSLILMRNSSSSVVYAEEHLSEIQYKLVEIEYGDSLWSIAEDNITPGFEDIKEYIQAIKECNQLTSDQINYGNYLLVPYYEVL